MCVCVSGCLRERERVRTRWVWFGFAILTQNFGQALLAIPTATVIRKGEAENERGGCGGGCEGGVPGCGSEGVGA